MSASGAQVSPTALIYHGHEVAGTQFGSVDRDTAAIVAPVASAPLWAFPSKTGRCRLFRREDLENTALLRLRGREPRRPRVARLSASATGTRRCRGVAARALESRCRITGEPSQDSGPVVVQTRW